jgi:hypothetical protein
MNVPAVLCIVKMTRYRIPGLTAAAGDVSQLLVAILAGLCQGQLQDFLAKRADKEAQSDPGCTLVNSMTTPPFHRH